MNDYVLTGIFVWVVALTIVVVIALWFFGRAYLKTVRENVRLERDIAHIEASAKKDAEAAAAAIAAVENWAKVKLDAVSREIRHVRDRWTIASWEYEDAKMYIEVLEENHHVHGLPLPAKPKRPDYRRPMVEPTNAGQYERDEVDELIADSTFASVASDWQPTSTR